jgi:hypothetical protein
MLVIVPNALRDAINEAIDKALADAPPDAAKDREHFYADLLAYYNEHGVIPPFSIGPVPSAYIKLEMRE